MKFSENLLFALLLAGLTFDAVWAQQPLKPYRPATAVIQNDLNPGAEPELTAFELATPPHGQIQKRWLRVVNSERDLMAGILAAVPAGPDGQGSPWFTKARAFKNGLDVISASSLQADCFALIPEIADLLEARSSDAPEFAFKAAGLANGFSPVLLYAIQRHIIDHSAVVSFTNLTAFTKVFSESGFISEGDWESEPKPINAAGIMILDPDAVVNYLKTQPWEDADRFIGSETGAAAFSRYFPAGDGMTILKTKYAAHQATITDKWNELAAWVVSHRPPD